MAAVGAKMGIFKSIQDLKNLLQTNNEQLPTMILGGGSNLLFTKKNYDIFFLKNEIDGIEKVVEDETSVTVAFGGGVVWHEAVLWAVAEGLGGMENLSLIPGTVGAAPIQNIGAYGVELKDIFVSLEAFHLKDLQLRIFNHTDCQFGYRESIFKKALKGQYAMTKVVLKLQKKPFLKTSYGDIQRILQEKKYEKNTEPTIKDVSDAVIQIRQSKLPNPSEVGNAGSFFKNPEIDKIHFENLITDFPTIPHYPVPNPDKVKVPAGWLIEQCGWKGQNIGKAGCHARQALVLINLGDAEGWEILRLAEEIIESVHLKFAIRLMPEVNIL